MSTFVGFTPRRRVLAARPTLYRTMAEQFVEIAARAVQQHGRFCVALTGGATPQPLYELLASKEFSDVVDWGRTEVFFGDERCVPPDDARSNFRMAATLLLKRVPLAATCLHRMRGEDEPAMAALRYRQELAAVFRTARTPRFDLILLGLGNNGHVASLFPGSGALRELRQPVVPQYVEAEHEWRLTFTRPVLNAAAHVWVLACGEPKAQVLQRTLDGPFQPEVLPAQYLGSRAGELVWWIDDAAALHLQSSAQPTRGGHTRSGDNVTPIRQPAYSKALEQL